MDAFSALYRLLSPARRRQLMATLGLMLLGAAAEMVTIGAALPFLALVADPNSALIPVWLLGLADRGRRLAHRRRRAAAHRGRAGRRPACASR